MTGTGLTKSVHEVLRRSGKMQVERHIGLEESTGCTFRIRHISVLLYKRTKGSSAVGIPWSSSDASISKTSL